MLRPDFRYLRVTVNGKAVLMVLGYIDADEHGRPIEVWYSADGEVLRTQFGRLIGLTGTPVEWQRVQLAQNMPAWQDLAQGRRFERLLDEMPGYRWRLVDSLFVSPIVAVTDSALRAVCPQSLAWFQEAVESGRLPVARYAVQPEGSVPVYGEQCLNESFCLTWQTWPPTSRPSVTATRR